VDLEHSDGRTGFPAEEKIDYSGTETAPRYHRYPAFADLFFPGLVYFGIDIRDVDEVFTVFQRQVQTAFTDLPGQSAGDQIGVPQILLFLEGESADIPVLPVEKMQDRAAYTAVSGNRYVVTEFHLFLRRQILGVTRLARCISGE
jgi:hypothetical protein